MALPAIISAAGSGGSIVVVETTGRDSVSSVGFSAATRGDVATPGIGGDRADEE